MSDTNITPSAAVGLTLAGIALTLVAGTVTIRTPAVGAVALAGVAPALVQQLQTVDPPGPGSQITLLTQASATGILRRWPGGAGIFTAGNVFGGATCTLQFQGPDNASMIPVSTATTITAAGLGTFHLPPGLINAAISSASGTTAITAAVIPTPTLIG